MILTFLLTLQDKATTTSNLGEHVQRSQSDAEQGMDFEGLLSQLQTPERSEQGPSDLDSASAESGGSSTSLETAYETDPDVDEGVIPQSQPCYKRGIRYTPVGLKRVYRKKSKLDFGDGNVDEQKEEK